MVPRLPVREGQGLRRCGGSTGYERRIRGTHDGLSGMQYLAPSDICCGRGLVEWLTDTRRMMHMLIRSGVLFAPEFQEWGGDF